MLLSGTLDNESFQFHVDLFADPSYNFTFRIRTTDNTYLLAQRSVLISQWMQVSGSYIEPKLHDTISQVIDRTDQSRLNNSVKPLGDLKDLI